MKMKRIAVALAAVGTLWAGATSAQQGVTAQQIAHACAGDIERLCKGVPPGEGRIKACIKAHITELSAPCFDTLLGALAAGKE